MSGRLWVVATPIGNLGDLSERAARVLREADVVACEDTRRTRKLLSHLGIGGPAAGGPRLVASHAHNERAQAAEIVELVAGGSDVALVSDAGTPAVSDPGQVVVAAVLEAGCTVEVVPGPSAALAALVASGFASERFCVEGFLPRKGPERRRRLAELATETRTAVVFEAPGRVAATLADLAEACGPSRRAAVCRELTKLHEETVRGELGEVAPSWSEAKRGEHVIVLAGADPARPEVTDAELAEAVNARRAAGLSRRDAADEVARELGVSRRRAYDSPGE